MRDRQREREKKKRGRYNPRSQRVTLESPSPTHTHTSAVLGTVHTRRYKLPSAGDLACACLVPTYCKMSCGMGCWKKTTVVAAVVVVLVAVAASGVAGRPNEDMDRSKDPVFNVWEYAISNNRYNPKREAAPSADPCTTAIVSCCLINSRAPRDHCFSEYGCPGAWFNNLCSNKFKGLVRNVVDQAFFGGF